MALCMEYESSFEREYDILEKTTNIEIDRAMLDYYRESSLTEVRHSFMEAGETDEGANQSGFTATIKRIVESIKRFLNTLSEMIQDHFGGSGNRLSPEEYFENPNTKIQLAADIRRVDQDIDKEILKGRKLVQMISSATGVSDETIAGYVDSAGSFLKKYGPIAITAAAAYGIQETFAKKVKERTKDVETLQREALEAEGNDGDKKRKKQKLDVFQAIFKLISTASGLQREYMIQLKKASKKQKRQQRRNK